MRYASGIVYPMYYIILPDDNPAYLISHNMNPQSLQTSSGSHANGSQNPFG